MKARLFPPYGVKPRPALRSSPARVHSLERGLLSLSGGKIRAFMACILLACCAAPAPVSAHAAESIPRAAYQYRDTLIRAAHAVWGLDAPVAVLAAQVHTESLWKADAVSPVGAMGIAQIMPSTARWLPDIAPALRGTSPAPYNPGWALRAMCEYDLWLHDRQSAMSAGATLATCDRMSFALSGYNGGLGWVRKDRIRARDRGLDPDRYAAVATVNAGRSRAAWKENRDYVRRIMARQELYLSWGPGVACE